jgi:uncharacterized protein (TIGR02246 family)
MNVDDERMVSDLIAVLENAWNRGDGSAFAQPFAQDADFVNIRGEHFRTREVIAKGHQGIFNTIYKGSVVRFQVTGVRAIAKGILLAHVKAALKAPTGPLAGEHRSLFTVVLAEGQDAWRIEAFQNTLIT